MAEPAEISDSVGLSPTLAIGQTADADPDRLAPGTRAGDYVVERFVGAGAMGEVYAGHHPVLAKKVAIKVLRRELATEATSIERFTREARAVNTVEHPNVVDVFAHGRLDDGRMFLVMSFVAGTTLRARLADGPLPIGDALAILGPVADALDAAHARGVVHRDLKPDNVMVSGARVWVLDFGIAKLVADGATGPGTLTGRGTWLGTPAYMAPEQWSTDGAGPASDRYSLGVVAFEVLAGSHPFAATSVPAMMEQHFRAAVPALSARGVAFSAAVDDVLRRMLAKDPDARFPTARAFVDALAEAAGSGAQPAHVIATRRPWLAPALGVGGLALAAAGVIAVRHDQRTISAPPPAADQPAPGSIALEVTSTPDHALVALGDRVIGPTPIALHVMPDTRVELRVEKPGYLTDHRSLAAGATDSAIAIQLGVVTRFEGEWRLPGGELRAFQRTDDDVSVFKVDEIGGARRFFKRYPFVAATAGIAFGADDEVVDPRAPDDPSCHQNVHVEYHYDAAADVLELDRPTAVVDFVAGHCVPRAQTVEAVKLVRVDQTHDSVRLPAPVGIPTKRPISKTKPTAKISKKQIDEPELKVPPSSVPNGNEPNPAPQQAPTQAPPLDKQQQQQQLIPTKKPSSNKPAS